MTLPVDVDETLLDLCERLEPTGLFGSDLEAIVETLLRSQLIQLAGQEPWRKLLLPKTTAPISPSHTNPETSR